MNRPQKTSLGSERCNAMVFYDEGADFLTAFSTAEAFGGDDGRVATLPDIVSARLRMPHTDTIWNRHLTTATAEYLGESKGGERLLIVAHGIGPLAGSAGVGLSHVFGYAVHGRSAPPGMIPREEFLRLESGAFGDVTVIELRELFRLRKFAFGEMLTYAQAADDPLVRARLGPEAVAYLAQQRKIAKRWWDDLDNDERFHDCAFSLCDTRRQGYASVALDDCAYSHLIDVSPLADYTHSHWVGPMRKYRSLVTETAPHATDRPSNCVGVRGKGKIVGTHPGVALVSERFAQDWRQLLRHVADDNRPTTSAFLPIARFGGRWFTRHAGTFGGPDDGQPCHPVTELKSEWADESFMMPIIGGDHQTVTVDEPLIRDAAPSGANTYRILTKPMTVWQRDVPTFHFVRVRYYAAEVACEWRLPTVREMQRDFDLLLSLGATREPNAETIEELSEDDLVDDVTDEPTLPAESTAQTA